MEEERPSAVAGMRSGKYRAKAHQPPPLRMTVALGRARGGFIFKDPGSRSKARQLPKGPEYKCK